MPQLRRQFNERLEALEDDVLGMGQRVLAMLGAAMTALRTRSDADAAAVISADDDVDAAYAALQQGLLAVLALEAPVAAQLRLVSALIHSSMHLERIGDLCVNIGRSVQRGRDLAVDPDLSEQVQEMGELARRLLERSLQSLARRDVDLARSLASLDDPLDQLNRGLFRRLVQLAARDEERLDWAFATVLVARCLERVGDHAVAIGAQVTFCVTGDVV